MIENIAELYARYQELKAENARLLTHNEQLTEKVHSLRRVLRNIINHRKLHWEMANVNWSLVAWEMANQADQAYRDPSLKEKP
jgi:regulator of replication initiation timing